MAIALPLITGVAMAEKKSGTIKVGDFKTVGCNKKCQDYDLKRKHKAKPPAKSSSSGINNNICTGVIIRKCPDGSTVSCTETCSKKKKSRVLYNLK